MKSLIAKNLVFGMILASSGALALPNLAHSQQLDILSTKKTRAPTSTLCRANAPDCALQEFFLVEQKKRLTDYDTAPTMRFYMTDMRAVYRTKRVEDIEKYAVVQFIRGCQFESAYDGRNIEKMLTIQRDYFGGSALFLHPDWMIDSDSTDPIYSSMAGAGRFALLRWNKNPASLEPATATYYAEARPPHSKVFVTDLPGTAFLTPTRGPDGKLWAKNVSLEFRTCIFRTDDLPEATDPNGSNIRLDKAISCIGWEHKYVYNYAKKRFDSPVQIDPICRTPLDADTPTP